MLTHKEVIRALASDTLARLKRRSNRAGLVRLITHGGALGATASAILALDQPLLLTLLLIVHGVLLVFLFAPLHESIHATAFRSPWLNRVVAEIAGFLLLLPPRYFRFFHFAHHRYTQDRDRDPELATAKPHNWVTYLRHLSGCGYWLGQMKVITGLAANMAPPGFVPPRARGKLRREARIYLLAYATLATTGIALGWTWLLWLWVVPALLGQPFLRAYLLAEHTACPLLPDMLVNSRTTFTGPLLAWLSWNMSNHTAHHVLPDVPFYQLGRLSALIRQHIACKASGYLAAHGQIIADWPGEPMSRRARRTGGDHLGTKR